MVAAVAVEARLRLVRGAAGASLVLVARRRARRGASAPGGCDAETTYHCAVVEPDPERESGRVLVLDGLRHSYVDLDDATHLEFDYVQAIASAVDTALPGQEAVDAYHLGAGGLTVPRYLDAVRPGSSSLVSEIDGGVVDVDRRRAWAWSCRRTSRCASRTVASGSAGSADDSRDLVVGDAFGGVSVPWHLATREAVAEVRRVLRDDGVYVANLIDHGAARLRPGRGRDPRLDVRPRRRWPPTRTLSDAPRRRRQPRGARLATGRWTPPPGRPGSTSAAPTGGCSPARDLAGVGRRRRGAHRRARPGRPAADAVLVTPAPTPPTSASSASPARPAPASRRWRRRSGGRWCRWTASTTPTPSWRAAGCWTARARPDTFDAPGYAALLRRVAAGEADVVAPAFDRGLEQPLAGRCGCRRPGRWSPRATTCCSTSRGGGPRASRSTSSGTCTSRRRRGSGWCAPVAFGKTPDEARAWVARVDDANARLVEAAAARADRVVVVT